VLTDASALEELLGDEHLRPGLIRTRRTPEYLKWRYGPSPVGYRVVLAGRQVREGLLFFRMRRRGGAMEAVVEDLIVPGPNRRRPAVELSRKMLESTGADYAVALGRSHPPLWPPVPNGGPLLTWRALAGSRPAPGTEGWDLSAGDIELF
jgi:hypothetical protein